MMKILHVISSMDPKLGGVSQAVRSMVQGLEVDGEANNEVVSLDAENSDFLKQDSFKTHALGSAKGPWGSSKLLKPWLVANLPQFDAVITHGLWQYQSHAVASSVRKIKYDSPGKAPAMFVMPHGMLDPYFQRSRSRRLKAFRNTVYWKVIEMKVANDSDGLLFTCEDEKILARIPFTPYQPKRELVVGLGVESPPVFEVVMQDAFNASCPGLGGRPYLLFLSRIHEKKGVDLLIRAYADLYGEAADDSPALVIAGPVDSDYAKEMQNLAKALSGTSRMIHFPGMLRGDAKFGAFYGCEAFVLPSHQENFGIAVVEALACGKPVLISDKVNIWREIVDDGGGLAESDDLDGATKLLSRWAAMGPGKRQSMSENAKDVFEKYFTIPRAAKRLLKALHV